MSLGSCLQGRKNGVKVGVVWRLGHPQWIRWKKLFIYQKIEKKILYPWHIFSEFFFKVNRWIMTSEAHFSWYFTYPTHSQCCFEAYYWDKKFSVLYDSIGNFVRYKSSMNHIFWFRLYQGEKRTFLVSYTKFQLWKHHVMSMLNELERTFLRFFYPDLKVLQSYHSVQNIKVFRFVIEKCAPKHCFQAYFTMGNHR